MKIFQVAGVVLDHPQRLLFEQGDSMGGDEVADDALDLHRRPLPSPDAPADSTT